MPDAKPHRQFQLGICRQGPERLRGPWLVVQDTSSFETHPGLPKWAVCCSSVRRVYEATGDSLELEVIPEPFMANVECDFCHTVFADVKCVHVYGQSVGFGGAAVLVECFDFEENGLGWISGLKF